MSLSTADALAISRRFADLSETGRRALKERLAARQIDLLNLPLVPMRGDGLGPWPLSFEQERLWFLWRLAPEAPAYTMAGALRLGGSLDAQRLKAAITRVTATHDSLRTRFIDAAGEGRQAIAAEPLFGWEETLATEASLAGHVARVVTTPFDLENGPVLRAALFRLGDSAGAHVLVLAMHHIVSDGWSIDLLLRDLARAYDGADLALPAIQYADYALWQRAMQDEEILTRQLDYWRDALRQEVEPLRLPADKQRGAERGPDGLRCTRQVEPSLADRLRVRARAAGTTLSTLLLAGWQAMLHRYGGQRQIRVGVVYANRERPEVQDLIGLFLNTLVLQADIGAETDFRTLLAQQHLRMAEARAHAGVPFARVVDALGLARSLSDTPLFQTIFNFQSAAATRDIRLGDLAVSDYGGTPVAAPFDLALDAFDRGGSLRLALTVAADLFTPETGARILDTYLALLDATTHDPSVRIGALPLPGTGPARRAVSRPFRSLTVRLAEAARAKPGALAVTCGTERVDHAALALWAGEIAARLRAAGTAVEEPVGLCVTRSAGLVAGLIGILQAGGAYLPLDPDFPDTRLAEMIADAGIHRIVADAAAAGRLAPLLGDCQIIAVEQDGRWDAGLVDAVHDPHPDQLAYVIYTSGSTGRPKGVGISHRALSLHVDDFIEAFSYSPADVALQFSTINFDAAAEQMLPLLSLGGHVVLRGPDAWTPADLTRAVLDERLSVADVPTAFWQEWARDLPHETHLRRVTVGGEALAGDHLAQWRRGPLGKVRLDNRYGPTETTMSALYHQTEALDERAVIVPIGRPYPSRSARILDEAGDNVPSGGVGELCIGGDSLARGYLGRPGLTAERFLPDAEGLPGSRLYRTGDLCRALPDGTVAFLGRVDGQVKLRGFRIELGEIEAALRARPGVQDAAAALRGQGDAARLVGYVVGEVEIAGLGAALAAHLPGHMIPGVFMALPALPLTPTGKIDRRALPEPPAAATGGRQADSAAEVVICRITAELLGLNEVSPEDDFFRLGGDSILSLRLVARARTAGLMLTPRLVFEHPRLAALAARAGAITEVASAIPETGSGPIPLTPIQADFFRRHPAGRAHWNQSVLLHVMAPLDEARLAAALVAMVQRHEALRLRFSQDRDGAWQARLGSAETAARFEVIDLAAEGETLEEAGSRVQAGLDIVHGPLVRAALIHRQGEDARLMLVIHHLSVDGVSWRILLDDLTAAYGGEVLPAAPGWSAWARGLAAFGASLPEEEATIWRKALDGASAALPLPVSRRRDAHRRVWRLGEARTVQLLRETAHAFRTTPEDLLLTAIGRAVARTIGQAGALVLVEGHGREEVVPGLDLSTMLGWFTVQYPVWLPWVEDAGDNLAAVKDAVRALPRRGLTWGLLPETAKRGLPVPALAFNYLGQFSAARGGGDGLPLALSRDAHGPALDPEAPLDHALDITGGVVEGALSLTWTADPQIWDKASLSAFIQVFDAEILHLVALCRALPPGVTAADYPLSGLPTAQLRALWPDADGIVDIYPATPLQQGMLYHALRAPGAGLYTGQLHLRLNAGLQPAALRAAFDTVIARHPVLRTGFDLRPAAGALQCVFAHAPLPCALLDWSEVETDYAGALTRFLEEDRCRGFDLAAPPLMRLTLILRPDAGYDLVWTSHHALLDGWSQSRLMGEIATAYAAIRDGQAAVFAPVRPYRDYIAWLSAQDDAAGEAWWGDRFAEGDAALLLPSLDQPTNLDTTAQGEHEWQAGDALSAALRNAARAHGLTFGTLLQGAWAILLSRVSGRRRVAFGLTVSGRPAALDGVEAMLGLFINSLPLRLDVPAGADLWSWLAEMQHLNAALRQHDHMPLARLARLGGLPADALFDSLLVFENYPVDAAARSVTGDLAPLAVRQRERTHYPLTLMVQDGAAGLTIRFLWQEALLTEVAVARLQADLAAILGQIVWTDIRLLDQIYLAGPAIVVPRRHSFRSVLDRIADQPETAVALTDGADHWTYRRLHASSMALAVALGPSPEERIGLAMDRSAALVAAMLGILQAGAAYVPLDPAYPEARLAAIIRDAGLTRIVADAKGRAALGESASGCTIIDPSAMPASGLWARPDVHPARLAYVIYTSGSTGVPKGVGISHAALARLFDSTRNFEIGARDVWTLFHSFAFDFSVWEIFGALCHGGRLVIVPAETTRDARAFHALSLREGVTVLNQTPSAFAPLMETDIAAPVRLDRLRLLIFGGEKLEPGLLAPWRKAKGLSLPRIVNMYGITETTVHVTARDMTDLDKASLIGAPLDDLSLSLMGEDGQPLGGQGQGEIVVGGAGLARGYLGRPGLTAERFVPDPLGPPGSRLYRSGDLGLRRLDGEVVYLGRADGQVKLRGFRIELGEIEAALRAQSGVRQAAVVLRQGRLAAYVTGIAGKAELDRVRTALTARMPAHMVPASIRQLEHLPLTVNGKLDQAMLPDPAADAEDEPAVAPVTETERAVADAAAAVLGLPYLSMAADFFGAGGDSITAMRFAARLAQVLNRDVPIAMLFVAPVLRDFAARLDVAPERQGIERRAEGAGPFPLSFEQERLWFLWRLAPEAPAYTMAGAIRLAGSLDAARLKAAFAAVVMRQDSLRTRFLDKAGEGHQIISPEPEFDWQECRIAEADLAQAASVVVHAPFDLTRGPLLRVGLFTTGPDETVLVIAMHHIISDGWSVDLLLRDLTAAYEGGALPSLPIRYADYALWQRLPEQQRRLAAQLGYWQRRLGSAGDPLRLPVDYLRPATRSGAGGRVTMQIDPALVARLRTLAKEEGATLFVLLLTAWQALLLRHADQAEIRTGIPFAGRARPDVQDLIGFCLNTLVLVAEVTPGMAWRDLLRQQQARLAEAHAHADLPFAQLVDSLGLPRSLTETPLFQTMFNLETAASLPAPAGLRASPYVLDAVTARFDLALNIVDSGDRLHAALTYAADLFKPETAQRLLQGWLMLLTGMAQDRVTRLGALQVDLSMRAMPAPAGYTFVPVHDRVHLSAVAAAHRTALSCEGRSLTHAELDRWSDAVAAALRAAGIGAESRVGLAVSRGPGLVAAMLGIFKAGGAFVPLDTDHPAARLRHMVEDAAPVCILVDEATAAAAQAMAAGCLVLPLPSANSRAACAPVAIHPDQLAYILYTSGSTGLPKGVAVSHRSLNLHIGDFIATHGVTAADIVLNSSTIGFDVALHEILPALIQGGRVVMRGAAPWTLDSLSATLAREAVTFARIPTALWSQWLRAGPPDLPALRQITVGGEGLPGDALPHWFASPLAHAALDNLYGPTETTVAALHHRVRPDDAAAVIVPIGRPYPGRAARILDTAGDTVPMGGHGELCIGGESVARGYFGRPGLTAERFVPNEAGVPGSRLYRSGDLCRPLADGTVAFLGRLDRQVKLRGIRIELGEIEAALRALPGVREAVVELRGAGAGARLVAYVVGEAETMRAQLTGRLPPPMVPSAFVRLAALPITPTGKLDRAALPDPVETRAAGRGPETAAEAALCGIVAQLLGKDAVLPEDNFFALGGDSLFSLRLLAACQQTGLPQVTLARIFAAGDLAELAAAEDLPAGVQRLNAAGHEPLFCLHPSYGSTAEYACLARALDGRMTLLGLDSPALIGEEGIDGSFSELAAHHLAHMRVLQPQGPYRLLGWSLGGWLAVEIAHQLEAVGEDVAFLGIVDTLAVASPETVTGQAEADWDEAAIVAHLRQAGAGHLIPARLAQGDVQTLSAAIRAWAAHNRQLQGYRLPHVAAPVTLWWSAETARRYADHRDWGALARSVKDHGILPDTRHLDILQNEAAVAAIAAGIIA